MSLRGLPAAPPPCRRRARRSATGRGNQALHPFERRGTPSVDTGIGPARSLTVDGILGPELLGHRCRTRLVPDLIGPADAVGVLLRHRLLPQPGGFEGLLAVE